ncbi:MAG TPA: penicillin-binding protein 1A [Steroidobacter sp.]|nr:penicillin-binding protein 1A [Steroidobacter sp.]
MRHYFSSPLRLALAALMMFLGIMCVGLLSAYQYLRPSLPDVSAIKDIRLQVPLRVYTRDGRLMAQFGEQRRIPLSFDAIPSQMVNAVLAAEDDRFFQHSGVDYPGLVRATVRHLLSGDKAEGGSTITMQLTRGIFLSPEKSYRRKLLEIFTTLRIERELTKQEILALYLNKTFLGQRAYGVGAAAEVYFGKTVDELTLPEIAIIAGAFRLPSRDNPVASADLARQRRAYVLRRMREKEFITQDEYDAALNAPVESRLHGPAVQAEAPYVAEMARAELLKRVGPEAYTAGYEVTTTVDSRLQRAASRALRAALFEYDQRHGYRGPVARVSIAPGSREKQWAAYVSEHPVRGGASPALVISIEDRSALAYSPEHGRINLGWAALSWARSPLPDGRVGPPLQRADEAVVPGDVIYVAQETSGAWRMVQAPEAQGAFVALDPQDGAVVALAGGFDYFSSSFNRAVQAKRQPGSAFKPFLYSAALEQGFTPASIVNDAPLVIEDPTLEASWRPQNDSREFRGPMRLREALVRSRNLVSIRVMNALGPAYATHYIERFGFPPSSLPPNLSLALGTTQASPLEMASAYAVFANGGYRVEPYLVQRITAADGSIVYEAQPRFACPGCWQPMQAEGGSATNLLDAPIRTAADDETRWGGLSYLKGDAIAPQAISAQNEFLMTDMMSDVVRRGTAARAAQLNRSDLAGKTGTTNDGRDAWFCGFTTQLVATAWVGFDQERSLGPGEQGSRTALPMWIYFMAEALKGVNEYRRPAPPGIVSMRVSADSGLAARPGESNAIFEYFMAERLPAQAETDSGPWNSDGDAASPSGTEESLF